MGEIHYLLFFIICAVSDVVRVKSIVAVCLPRGKSNLLNKFIFSDSVLNFPRDFLEGFLRERKSKAEKRRKEKLCDAYE